MKFFLVFIFFFFSSSFSTESIFSIVEGGLGQGYDIVNERHLLPVVQFHYDANQVAKFGNINYLVPDEAYFTKTPGGREDNVIRFIESFSAYYKYYWSSTSFTASASIDGIDLNFAFSHTKAQIENMLANKTKNFARQETILKAFELELFPGFSLHPSFQRMVDTLPKSYDQGAYMKLVHYWGTHYISLAQYGGKYNFTSIWDTSLYSKYSMDWVENQVSISIGIDKFHFGINTTGISNKTKVDEEFKKASHEEHTITGGSQFAFDQKGWDAWYETLQTSWGIIAEMSQLTPLYELIDDPVKASFVKRAILEYGGNH